MGNLGSLEPEALFQLFVGSLSCAFIIFLLTISYILIARSSKRARKRTNLGATISSSRRAEPGRRYPSLSERTARSGSPVLPGPTTSLPMEGGLAEGDRLSPVDMGARLAGLGREAWLEESPLPSPATPPVEESTRPHGKEILRVVRDPSTGEVWTKVAGVRYRGLNDIRDRAVGERVLAAITHFLRFSGGLVATDQGVEKLNLPPCDAVKVPIAVGVLSDAREPGEILRLISNPDQGEFCVHIVERCYHRLVEVADQAVGQSILETITYLLQFSNGRLATNDGLGTVPVPSFSGKARIPLPPPSTPSFDAQQAADSASVSPGPSLDSQQSATPASLREQELFLRQLMSQSIPLPEEPVERPGLLGGLRRKRKKPSDEPLPTLNLVEEINCIFQSKLALSPLSKTDAEIETDPDGGIRIRVGTAYYDTPDDVPDANLRHMLKLSIAEWEQS